MKKLLIILLVIPLFSFASDKAAKFKKLTCEEAKSELETIEEETRKIEEAKQLVENYKQVTQQIAQLQKEKARLLKKIKQAEQQGYLEIQNNNVFFQTESSLKAARNRAQNRAYKACTKKK